MVYGLWLFGSLLNWIGLEIDEGLGMVKSEAIGKCLVLMGC